MPRRWLWFGLGVELWKPVAGAAYGAMYFSQAVCSATQGIFDDLVNHYQYLRAQEDFAAQVAADLESLPDS